MGLGNLGAPVARRIAAAGYPLTLWARRPESLTPLADVTRRVAASRRDLAASVDLVGVCVRTDQDVCTVMTGDDGVLAGARPGTVVAIHSTVHPETCRRLAEEAGAGGVTVIDAPLSGGHPAAENGDLLVMTGGDEAAAKRCRPVFETFGSLVLHMGPIGTAQRAKLVNNTLLTANIGLAAEAVELGRALDIDPDMLVRALQHGTGRSFGLGLLARVRAEGGFAAAGWGLLRKDVDLLVDAAARADADGRALVEPAERFLDQTKPEGADQ
ncbi:MAG TPA: NAD(P)-dependent oxidoreductase [Acidimicrobiales bacterium]|nr:NAD(P)-dependent oxidoreductase [Acidimicrobiales bacterium]